MFDQSNLGNGLEVVLAPQEVCGLMCQGIFRLGRMTDYLVLLSKSILPAIW